MLAVCLSLCLSVRTLTAAMNLPSAAPLHQLTPLFLHVPSLPWTANTHRHTKTCAHTHACTALHKWRETDPFHPRRGHTSAASERFPCQHVCSHQQGGWQAASNPRTSHAACSVSQFIWGLNYILRWMIALLLATFNQLSFTVCSVELPKGNLHLLSRPDKDSKNEEAGHKVKTFLDQTCF